MIDYIDFIIILNSSYYIESILIKFKYFRLYTIHIIIVLKIFKFRKRNF